MKQLIAAVLCGGESKRMGTDKGLLPIMDKTWALFMADKLSFLQVPVFFSVNELQLPAYSNLIPQAKLVTDHSNIKGPAGGLLSLHSSRPANDILIIACDMLDLDKDTIADLVNCYTVERNHDFYVYQDEQYAQPFCGIYTANGIAQLKNDSAFKSMTHVSMQYVLNTGNTRRMPIIKRAAFRNYNTIMS